MDCLVPWRKSCASWRRSEVPYFLAKEVLIANGDVRVANHLQVGQQSARIIGILAVIPFGLMGACWGLLLAALAGSCWAHRVLAVKIGLTFRNIFQACAPCLTITLISTAPALICVGAADIGEHNYFVVFAAAGIGGAGALVGFDPNTLNTRSGVKFEQFFHGSLIGADEANMVQEFFPDAVLTNRWFNKAIRVLHARAPARLWRSYGHPGSHRLERFGSDYGGWFGPTDLVRSNWNVYSFGIGQDTTFDETLIDRFGVTVQAFDPTPFAVEHVAQRKQSSRLAREKLLFEPVGVWDRDCAIQFFAPKTRGSVGSYSALNLRELRAPSRCHASHSPP